jgi:hypothetical protein
VGGAAGGEVAAGRGVEATDLRVRVSGFRFGGPPCPVDLEGEVGGAGRPTTAVRPAAELRRRSSSAGRAGLDGRRGGVRVQVRKSGVAGRGGGRAGGATTGQPPAGRRMRCRRCL